MTALEMAWALKEEGRSIEEIGKILYPKEWQTKQQSKSPNMCMNCQTRGCKWLSCKVAIWDEAEIVMQRRPKEKAIPIYRVTKCQHFESWIN